MYDQVPQISLDLSDPLWPVFAVPAAGAALSFLWADWGQRAGVARGYLKQGYVFGMLAGPLGTLTALLLPSRPDPLLDCERQLKNSTDFERGPRWLIGQLLGGILWAYLGLLLIHLPADAALLWPSWLDPLFNLKRDWGWHLLISVGLAALTWRTLASRAAPPLHLLRPARLAATSSEQQAALEKLLSLRWRLALQIRMAWLLDFFGKVLIAVDVFAFLFALVSLASWGSDPPGTALALWSIAVGLLAFALLQLRRSARWREGLSPLVAEADSVLDPKQLNSVEQEMLNSNWFATGTDEFYSEADLDYDEDYENALINEPRGKQGGSEYGQVVYPDDFTPMGRLNMLDLLIRIRLSLLDGLCLLEPQRMSVGNAIIAVGLSILGILLFLGFLAAKVWQAWFVASGLRDGINYVNAVQQSEPHIWLLITLLLAAVIALVLTIRALRNAISGQR